MQSTCCTDAARNACSMRGVQPVTDRRFLQGPRARRAREQASRLYHAPRARRSVLVIALLLVVFGLLGFFAAPPIIKSQLQQRLGHALNRPVTLAAAHLNPFSLRLQLDRLHVGAADGNPAFVDVDQLVVNASWASLFRMAPVIDEITVQHPQIRLRRTGPQQFNISDLLTRYGGPSDPKAQPTRFALANISVHNGDIQFDDQVQKTTHRVEQLELGIPFLANLPSSTDVYVKPLLAARVDGSPLHIEGRTKPFARSLDSSISFELDHLDLPRYLGYVPPPLPVAIPSGQLSGQLQLHFSSGADGNQLRLGGQLVLDDFRLTTPRGVAIVELKRGSVELADVQPLIARYYFGAMALDRPTVHYHRGPDGHSNIDPLTSRADMPAADAAPTDLRIATLTLQDGHLDYADLGTAGSTPATLSLTQMQGSIEGLATLKAAPATLKLDAGLNGGSVQASGTLALADARFIGTTTLKAVKLAPLKPLVMPALHADISSGTLDASGQLQADWAKVVNLHLATATIAVKQLALKRNATTPVKLASMTASLSAFDLAGRSAKLGTVTVKGLKLALRRLRDGQLDLTRLLGAAPPGTHASASPDWHWQLAHLVVTGSDVDFSDLTAAHPKPVTLHAERYSVDGLSNDMHAWLAVKASGQLDKRAYALSGKVRPQPLQAQLRVTTRGLDIAPLQSLISVPLNVRIGSAHLSLNGRLGYRDRGSAPAQVDFQGDAQLRRVRVQDKLTGDDFLRWHSLDADNVKLRLGDGAPQLGIDGLALSDFYARVIVNASGRLNLQDVVVNGNEAPVSVTREEGTDQPAATTRAPTEQPDGPAPVIRIGQISVARGQLNYTDNFIKPNYTANITDLAGKIGGFGTEQGPPAELQLQGKLDEKAPIEISGTINPLTPVAFLDIKGKADGVELTGLSPYSGRYAGYPIASGVLNVDVRYQLDQRTLKADNHIFIEQLTFGDRINEPGVSHLPVKLAVALLKDSQGRIDVHVPVSGSLDSPQFSIGKLVWRAIGNLIARAATSPFRLLASIGGGKHADLAYVAFQPGSAVLDATAQARLTQLVALLKKKPSLKLDITGRMDPAVDEKGLRKVMVDDKVRAAKAEHEGVTGDVTTLKLTPDEYEHYLVRVYKDADFPKAKNFVGLTRSQPPEVMQQLLQTNMPVDDVALRQLAERRAAAVDAWLKGKLEPARITVHPPQLDAKGISDKGPTSRVDFGLH